jgi:hypothetical protein
MLLPMARADGICCRCNIAPAITRDRRFCQKCLRAFIREISPGTAAHCDRRSYEQKQDMSMEPSPWQENAVRHLEGGP